MGKYINISTQMLVASTKMNCFVQNETVPGNRLQVIFLFDFVCFEIIVILLSCSFYALHDMIIII